MIKFFLFVTKKKIFLYVFLILLFNFYVSVQALDSPKNYLKGKFYSSVKNNFLVATGKMRDPRFANTVIVMLKNDESGSFGLVINKPLGFIPLGSLINKVEDQSSKQNELYNVKVPIYWGGPVEENIILVLHSKEYQVENTKKYKDISVSSGYKILLENYKSILILNLETNIKTLVSFIIEAKDMEKSRFRRYVKTNL